MESNLKQIWRSKRLVYRGMVFPHDEGYLMDHSNDSYARAMSDPGLMKPPSTDSIEAVKKFYNSCLLTVIICIPKENAETASKEEGPPKSTEAWVERQKMQLTQVGVVILHSGDPYLAHHRSIQVGLGIDEAYRGKGYGPEAVNWVTDWAFAHAGMHRVSIGAFAFNEHAWQLYEKLGFRHEARLKKAVWHNGDWHDSVELAMLEDEWRELRKSQKKE